MNNETGRHAGGNVTNVEIARRLGLSESGVHRIRNGTRYPSLAVMRRIQSAYGWPLDEQVNLIPEGAANMDYANEFERRVTAKK